MELTDLLVDWRKNMSILSNVRIFLSNIRFLTKYRLNQKFDDYLFQAKDEILDDMVYEYDENKQNLKKLKILDEKQTVDLLMSAPKSFVRFGDGEINLMKGISQPFQKYEKSLVDLLYQILNEKQENLYIGLNKSYFQSAFNLYERGKYFRLYGTEFRRFFLEQCNPHNVYIDAAFTVAYFSYLEDYDYKAHYERMTGLFKGKKIAVVCGEGVIEKLQYDVFQFAEEKIIIHGPSKHAFDSYMDIIEKIRANVPKNHILCFILGMAGKAMIKELTDDGYMAWDIGHMAKDYDYYMRNVEKTIENRTIFYAPD